MFMPSPRILFRRFLKVYCLISTIFCLLYLFSDTKVPMETKAQNRNSIRNVSDNLNGSTAKSMVRKTNGKSSGSTAGDFAEEIKLSDDVLSYSAEAGRKSDFSVGMNTSLKQSDNYRSVNNNQILNTQELPGNWRQTLEQQNSLYDHSVVKAIPSIQVGYLTAVALPSSSNVSEWAEIAVNGWQRKKFENVSLYCCVSSPVSSRAMLIERREVWTNPEIKVLLAVRFICNNPWKGHNFLYPKRVALSTVPKCREYQYINVEYPKKPDRPDSIAFCGKILYGNYPAGKLIEWIEMNKMMGVNHVSLFTYNITEQAMAVLKHYHQEGYLTLKEFDFPLKAIYPRYIGQKYLIAWIDEQVTVFDCISRFREYKYVGILDVDEFLVPKHKADVSYIAMLDRILTIYPNAAGFTFQTQLFISNWGETHPGSSMMITKYRNRTKAMWDRRKSIFMPSRVDPQSIWTHGFQGIQPYHRYYLLASVASLFHYRNCRPQWIRKGVCLKGAKRFTDNTMQRFAAKIQTTVTDKTKLLLN